jgi:hypothetical protein
VNKYVISNYIDRLWKYNTECNFNLFSLLTKKYCIWSVILYHQSFICHFNFIWYHTLKSKMSQRKYSGKQYLCTFCIVKGKYHFLDFHDRLIKCFACSHWKCHPIPNNFDVSIHSSKTNLQNIFLVSFCKSGSFTDVFDNKLVLYLNIIKTFHFYIFLIPSHKAQCKFLISWT